MTPDTREQYASHIPALKVLMALGWEYLSTADCLAKRGGTREVILKDELIAALQRRRFEYRGNRYPLSANAVDQIVRELAAPGLNEGLQTASEKLFDKLCLGVTVTEFIDGKKHNPTVPIIDWDDIGQNRFQVTEELEVASTGGTHTRTPDIVGYVNGLPLFVIEAKRPESGSAAQKMLDEGISQQIRNQKNDEIPLLFAYAQLLLAVNGAEGRYGTTRTDRKFWARWREEMLTEAHFAAARNAPLDAAQRDALFAGKPAAVRRHFETLWSKPGLCTDQDRLLVALLAPERLLEFVRYFILYDTARGKIAARYPQVFGIKALIERIQQRRPGGGREGGVLWHTTGSGKSLTMVMLCRALLLHPALKECRLVVVTDRRDLEKQLADTFMTAGAFGSEIATKKEGERSKVRSGKDLARRIGQGTERIVFTLIHKFNNAARRPECRNASPDLIVLVDEGHRSQGGENHERMRTALPNAAYIAFTGTPLLKADKTANKFGPIVHAYTMQRAVEDETVTPLLYEERRPELAVNEAAIDNWFERITAPLSERQKADLKRKFAKKGAIYGSDNRIELIAWDIAAHFHENIKALDCGLKGQIAADSKLSAIRYKKHLDATGLVTSTVIISPPDTREGHDSVDEPAAPEVQQWWKENVTGDPEARERQMIQRFGSDGDPDLLIVVDKLLTGFDEPRNTVLYIDKPLKEHNLMQAIARVNRLHEQKPHGLLIDYRGICEELDTSVKKYQDLAARTQCGYDIDDIEGLYRSMSAEYRRLPLLHEQLWAVFADVKNRGDREQFRQVLLPDYALDGDGHYVDRRQKVRDDFYAALTEFGLCLRVALSTHSFFEDRAFPEAVVAEYKRDLKFFSELRATARRDAQETVDYSSYEKQLRRLVDKHVVGNEIREPDGTWIVGDPLFAAEPSKWSDEKTRNETDLIRTRIRKTIESELADDPYARKVFSELLKQAIAEAEAQFDHPRKLFAVFKAFEDKVKGRDIDGMPESLARSPRARAYYGAIRLALGEARSAALGAAEIARLADEALAIERVVDAAVAEHSLNLRDMEAAIRNGLLPGLFQQLGMDKAREVIDMVVQITRVHLAREAGG